MKAQAKEIPVEDMTLVFDAGLSGNGPRELMNLLLDRGAEICMVFAGGGKPEMVQGTLKGSEEDIRLKCRK